MSPVWLLGPPAVLAGEMRDDLSEKRDFSDNLCAAWIHLEKDPEFTFHTEGRPALMESAYLRLFQPALLPCSG